MMETLRKNMKIVLWIVVVAFIATIFFVWGKGGFSPEKTVAVVNGEKITYDEWYQIYYSQKQNWQDQLKQGYSDAVDKQIRNMTFQQMILRKMVMQEARKMGISISNDELVDRIKHLPQLRCVLADGSIDEMRFKEIANDPKMQPVLKGLEQQEKENLIINKVQRLIADGAKVTLDDIKRQYTLEYGSRKAQYIFFTFKLSGAEAEEIRQKGKDLANRAKAGEDFAMLARQFSQDPGTKDKGGDLGLYKREELRPDFQKGITNFKPGEIGGPIKTDFGYHIVKLGTDTPEGKIHVYHILLRLEANEEKKKKISEQADAIIQQTRTGESFEKIASKYGEIRTTSFYSREDKQINDIKEKETVNTFIDKTFLTPLDAVCNPFATKDGVYVVKIIGRRNPTEQQFEKDKSQFTLKAMQQKGDLLFNTWLLNVQSRSKFQFFQNLLDSSNK